MLWTTYPLPSTIEEPQRPVYGFPEGVPPAQQEFNQDEEFVRRYLQAYESAEG